MRVHQTDLHGVLRLEPEVFRDHRGSYVELFDTARFTTLGIDREFVQDDISVSHTNVLRGLHGDYATTKLVSVLAGEGYALLADNRPASPTYRRWQAFTLSEDNRNLLLLPPGIGNSVYAVRGPLVYWYKQTTHFVKGQQFTIRWDDPEWGFVWPTDAPILSARDARGSYVTTA